MGDWSWFTLKLAFNREKKRRLGWKKWRWRKAPDGARVCSRGMRRPWRGGGSAGEGCQFSLRPPAMAWRTEAPAHVHAYAVSPSLACCPPSSPPDPPDPSSAAYHWLQNNPQPNSPLPETPLLPTETLLQVSPEHTKLPLQRSSFPQPVRDHSCARTHVQRWAGHEFCGGSSPSLWGVSHRYYQRRVLWETMNHSCIGERNGNPLECSFLENPMDRSLAGYSPWGCKSRTQLSD